MSYENHLSRKFPFLITTLSIILGVAIAILFGINEDLIKDKIKNELKKNPSLNQIEDPKEFKLAFAKEKAKNWRYYQRFHFHSTGIGAISLGALILLSMSLAPNFLCRSGAYMISCGGALYPFVWLFSGVYGPIIGREQAKERFAIFGYMGGIYLLGLLILFYCLAKYPLNIKNADKN